MLTLGSLIDLLPEKPVVGGRMLARVEGEVVLVAGTIPGERVRAKVERRQQGVWFATTVDVLEASPDRVDPGADPACGGMAFAHIAYARQCELKAAIVADAIARIARAPLPQPPAVTPSPPHGYRSRYRVHFADGRLGFFREGTHEVCDAGASNQLALASLACLASLAARLDPREAAAVDAFEVMENLPNTERALNLAMREGSRPSAGFLAAVAAEPGLTGVTWSERGRGQVVAASGRPWVSDPVTMFVGEPGAGGGAQQPSVRRHAASFFQANRFLAPLLARTIAALVGDGPIVDLYAGVGLFAVALAACGRRDITAIEQDPVSARDLLDNAQAFGDAIRVERMPVEAFLARPRTTPVATLIVDPPRTGMSRAAMAGILAATAPRIVYVSCDVATLARDTRRLLDAGYTLASLEAIDMFPNTAHVEGIAVFDRQR